MASASSNSSESLTFSEYYSTLSGPTKARYHEKVKICGFDPYTLKKGDCSEDIVHYPSVSYPDIINYLVIQTSWKTGQEMKAWKSMDAYNFFISGWVNTILLKSVQESDKVVVTARVNHSQRARDTPLKTWLLAEKDGSVCFAHCTCMAGLCEACSHVGALLFALEAGVRMNNSVTCTQEKGKWLMPSYVREIPYMPVCEMDLSSAKKRYSSLGEQTDTPQQGRRRADVPRPTIQERSDFYQNISQCGIKPAILSLVPPYNEKYVPKHNTTLPLPLTHLFNEDNLELNFQELLEKCNKAVEDLKVSCNEAAAIESSTISQSSSKDWFQQRAGRITASKFKAACRTSQEKPSTSLIKAVCYPEAHKFSNPATKWGISKESVARDAYQFAVAAEHVNLSVAECGLHINEKWPYIGASPDGLVFCECCGNGICEIKCPHKHRNSNINEAVSSDPQFCLKRTTDNKITLSKSHAYYFQVQCQIFVTGVEYCDFVVWTKKDIYIQRILPDSDFWGSCLENAKHFFVRGVLPELLGKYFTRAVSRTQEQSQKEYSEESEDDGSWCFCQQAIEGSCLIGCDNTECPTQWFHMTCVGLAEVPDNWFCSTCSK